MSQLVLESENEYILKLIQELAENLAIHCLFIPQNHGQQSSVNANKIDDVIQFVKDFSQEKTSFGDAYSWQKIERQERLMS